MRRHSPAISRQLEEIDDLDRRTMNTLRNSEYGEHSPSIVKNANIFYFCAIKIRELGQHDNIAERNAEQDLIRRSFGFNLEYPLTFYLRHEKMIRSVRTEEALWQEHSWEAWKIGARGSYRIKLNARVRSMQPIHDMIRWYSRSVHVNGSSRHTIVMHPHLLEFLRLYRYNAQTVIEGMLFGDSERHDAVRTMGRCDNALGDITNIPATTYRYKFIGSLEHYYSCPNRDTIVSFICQIAREEQRVKYLQI